MLLKSTQILASVILIFFLTACERVFVNRLDIVNNSGSVLTEVNVIFSEKNLVVNDIKDGRSVRVGNYVDRDGVIVLEYTLNGKRFRRELIYITSYVSTYCHVIILRNDIDKKCSY
jgi:hypothetical protein